MGASQGEAVQDVRGGALMPLYVYKCPKCGKEREELVRPLLKMPDLLPLCSNNGHGEGVLMRRIPAPSNFQLKGKW